MEKDIDTINKRQKKFGYRYINIFFISLFIVNNIAYTQEITKKFETDFKYSENYGNWSSVDQGDYNYSFYIKPDTSIDGNVLNIDIDKKSWQFLQLWIKPVDIKDRPYILCDLKSDTPVPISVMLVDTNNTKISTDVQLTASQQYNMVLFDFHDNIDKLTGSLQEVRFKVNGNKPFKGNICIQDIKMGNAINTPILSIAPRSALVKAAAGETKIEVINLIEPVPMEWFATVINEDSPSGWVHLTDENTEIQDTVTGKDHGYVTVSFDANNGMIPRKAKILVWIDKPERKSEEFTLTQLPNSDYALAIDRSASMEYFHYMEPVKKAAEDFTGLLPDGDHAAIVSFNHKAKVEYGLHSIEGSVTDINSTRTSAISAIEGITAYGYSSIGDGIKASQQELDKNGHNIPWMKHQNIVLLSDGYENFPPLFDETLSKIPATTDIFTIGLSRWADDNLLAHIASSTGGTYIYTPDTSDLQQIYNFYNARTKGQEVLAINPFDLLRGDSLVYEVPVDSLASIVNFALTIPDGKTGFTVTGPEGTIYRDDSAGTRENVLYRSDDRYRSYYINLPKPGTWKVTIKTDNINTAEESGMIIVSAYSNLKLETGFDKESYRTDDTIVISATITGNGKPVTGTQVDADVTFPLKADTVTCKREDHFTFDRSDDDLTYETTQLTLYDDGAHGDGQAGDGQYANYFTHTLVNGSYTFDITATGDSPSGRFSRYDMRSVVVSRRPGYEEDSITVPGQYRTIQQAINAAYRRGGGTVWVSEGTYRENIVIYNTVWVIAKDDPARTIIDGKGKGNTVVMDEVIEGGIIGFTIQNSKNRGQFAGIKITGDQTPVVGNCIIKDNNNGMFVAGNVRAFISNNDITGNDESGIRVNGIAQSILINNIIEKNDIGIEARGHPVKVNGYNDIWDNKTDLYNFHNGTGDISSDPQFIDRNKSDYRLSAASPCIDAGHYQILDTDATRSDMGAYGGMSRYWREFFISDAWITGERATDHMFGDTRVKLSYTASGLKCTPHHHNNYDTTIVSKVGKQLFFTSEDRGLNVLWSVYSSDVTDQRTMTFCYTDDEVTKAGLDENSLVIARYDKDTEKWLKLGSIVSVANKTVSVTTNDINGYWTLLGTAPTNNGDNNAANDSTGNEVNDSTANGNNGSASLDETGTSSGFSGTVYPNPSNGIFHIEFSLQQETSLDIVIYDASGRFVKSLAHSNTQAPGTYTVTWNGTDADGNRMKPNLYILHMVTGEGVRTQKLILIR